VRTDNLCDLDGERRAAQNLVERRLIFGQGETSRRFIHIQLAAVGDTFRYSESPRKPLNEGS